MYAIPKSPENPLMCVLCKTVFKSTSALNKHQKRKTTCVGGEQVFEYLDEKKLEMKEFVERMELSEEHSDMFRKLHVRSQKQLAAWRKDHEKCNVTLQQEAEKEDPEAFTLEDKPRESFFKKSPVKTSVAEPTNIRAPGQSAGSFFANKSTSTNSGNDNAPTVSWSSTENPNGSTTTTTTSTSTSAENAIPDWAKQFQKAPWNQNGALGTLAPTTLPNGQVVNPANMTTTNTTTTNVTNNIININVKLCAPGFESIDMSDSRGFNFTEEKKQEIADHLQKLLEIMMDDEPNFNHYDYGQHDYKKDVYPNAMS